MFLDKLFKMKLYVGIYLLCNNIHRAEKAVASSNVVSYVLEDIWGSYKGWIESYLSQLVSTSPPLLH